MIIGPFDLRNRILLIAEIGNNHEGSVALAEEMIGKAAEAGAGAVKFQTIVPERLVSVQHAERVEQLKRFQLGFEEFAQLKRTADREGVLFLSTPFDLDSIAFLDRIVPAFKIASGDNNFFPLLETVAATGKPVLMSTGMADEDQVRASVSFLRKNWETMGIRQEIALLHCVASYPTPVEQANLLALKKLEGIGDTLGYSDHTLGIDAAVLAVALGARVIEKHFTLDKNYSDFRDHSLSADPGEFAELADRIQETLAYLGKGDKRIMPSETGTLAAARRSISASMDLERGTIIEWEHLTWVRPGGGLEPGREDELLGKALVRSIKRGERISSDDVLGRR